MREPLHRIKYIVPFLVLIIIPFCLFSQETRQDTLTYISKYKTEALNALSQKNYDVAVKSISKANRLVSHIDNENLKIEIKLTASKVHYAIQDFENAASENLTAIDLLEKSDDKSELAKAYLNYASILTKKNDFTNAERFFKKADIIFTELNDEKNQSITILGLGIVELNKGNPTAAINYFNAAIPLYQSFDMRYEEALSYLNKAEALLLVEGNENTNQVKIALNKANRIIEEDSFSILKIQTYKIASYIALRENNYSLAEKNIERYETKNDSIYKVYLKAISEGLIEDSNVGDLNNIIAKQSDELDKNKKSFNFNKMTNGLSIALIVILSLLTLSLYKNNNLRAKANELLQDKNNELQLAKEKAEKASLAKAQFLSTITHELRTPLYAVTGLTHLLMEENPKEHQKEHLNSLKFSGEYLLSLINNILDLNKLEANKVEIEKTSFNLKKRINDVLVALRKSADDRKNNLHFEFDETIPVKLAGDPLKLSQILINLIGNSVKFTQNGDVTVRVKKLDQNKNKVSLHFEIEDNGVGISKKKQKSIFETFSQGSLQINRKFGGTGLGLSIVKNLLELMNSKIHLESQLGKGSKFWFNINFDIAEEFKDDVNPNNIIYDVDYVALENKKILVVEDNKINQMITKKILEKNKMICMVADNGMDAIKLVQENTFDAILMDIHMPGISGIEATQKIRGFNKEIPIIALTAVTIDENLDDFYRAGFNEIIPKPFKTEEFFEKIYRTLENKSFPVNS